MKRSTQSYTVEQSAFEIWRDHMFDHLNEKVMNAAIKMLERNRNGEIISAYAIKDVIQSYIDLGSIPAKDSKDSKKLNETDVLKVMLCDTFS